MDAHKGGIKMYFRVKNRNIESGYSLLLKQFETLVLYDKATGCSYYSINIETLQNLIELDSICKQCNDSYVGVKLSGNEITLLETLYEFERYNL